jgi:hypothetical protein
MNLRIKIYLWVPEMQNSRDAGENLGKQTKHFVVTGDVRPGCGCQLTPAGAVSTFAYDRVWFVRDVGDWFV